jgi:hypothetical protein
MNSIEKPRGISPADLAQLGLQWVAYIKPVEIDGATGFAIFAADGRRLAIVPSRDAAIATARANDLEPVSLH